MAENWKPVAGYEGRYEVSDLGRVRSLITTGRGSNSRRSKTQIMGPSMSGGYLRVALTTKNHKLRNYRVHRLVAIAFLPPPSSPKQITVNHISGNKRDNRTANLEWATMHEQNEHKYKVLGMKPRRGVTNGSARRSETDVSEIRGRHARGTFGYGALAKQFGVSKTTIQRIIKRRLWSHAH